jgi:hypothetical protein
MDVVALGLAKADAAGKYAGLGSSAAPFMSRLAGGRESAAMLVMGDSTGDESSTQGRWVLLTAQWLAAKFPAYTVNFRQWNFGADAWDPLGTGQSRVLQVGTGTANSGGPFVIDIYNGSASGQAPNYHYNTARWNKHTAVGPFQLVFINHGHNIGSASGPQGAYEIGKLARTVRDKYPLAGIMLTAQNPAGPSAADFANDYLRARSVHTLAGIDGYGMVNIFQAFLNNGNYVTNLTNSTDGLWVHPNAAGSALWAREVQKHLNAGLVTATPARGPQAAQDRLWVPAKAFDIYAGTPTFALVNSEQMMWSFANGVDSEVIATVDLPAHWAFTASSRRRPRRCPGARSRRPRLPGPGRRWRH